MHTQFHYFDTFIINASQLELDFFTYFVPNLPMRLPHLSAKELVLMATRQQYVRKGYKSIPPPRLPYR